MNRFVDRGGLLPGLERDGDAGRHARVRDDGGIYGDDFLEFRHATGRCTGVLGGGHSVFPFFSL